MDQVSFLPPAQIGLTQKYLHYVLHYDPVLGEFYWRHPAPGRSVAGPAGSVGGSGYRYICIDGKQYSAGRLAWFYMYGRWPQEIDHINRDPDDDRWENLREVSRRENNLNRGYVRASPHPDGVTKDGNGYAACASLDGKNREFYWAVESVASAIYQSMTLVYDLRDLPIYLFS